MKRALFASVLLFAGFAGVCAQGSSNMRQTTVTMGWVRQPDGTMKSVAGQKLWLAMEKVAAAQETAVNLRGPSPDAIGYLNDNGENSYFMSDPEEFPTTSALDDLVMGPAGQGTVWNSIMWGMYVPRREVVLVRMQIFDRFVSGRGPGVSAFDDLIADFGFFVDCRDPLQIPQVPWNYRFTIPNLGVLGIVVPDGECYFAIQIREPLPSGEGPFAANWQMLFSGGGVGVGSSQDYFYYDWDPVPDGIYDETELDYFGGPPNEANFLLRIETGGTATEVLPTNITVLIGRYRSGSFIDLWYSDDSYYIADSYDPAAENEYPIKVLIESTAPAGTVVGFRFRLESHAQLDNVRQQIRLYNFVTNQWVLLSDATINTTDVTNEAIVIANPAQYVRGSDRKVMAQVQWKETASESAGAWKVFLDRAVWSIVRP